jgi:predicted CoA-substrate-specific enzyme activase
MIAAGIDAGSRTLKVVLLEIASQRVLATVCTEQTPDQVELASRTLAEILERARLSESDLARVVATGYGRNLIPHAHTTVTEITCLARGARHLRPEIQTLVDIGGQDSKVIFLDAHGVRDFAMNDRCAAGTGQYLEMVARRLAISLAELGRHAQQSTQPATISSMCAVFAETEIISLLATGKPAPDIVAGVLQSVASRVAGLAARSCAGPVGFAGGVALIRGMDHILSQTMGSPVEIMPEPQLCAARGAALIACESVLRESKRD